MRDAWAEKFMQNCFYSGPSYDQCLFRKGSGIDRKFLITFQYDVIMILNKYKIVDLIKHPPPPLILY